jgi:hypothetical protein
MKYQNYTTPLTEQNFVAACSLLSTMSVADDNVAMVQDCTPSQPNLEGPRLNSFLVCEEHAKNRYSLALNANKWKMHYSLLLHDWSNLMAVAEERSVATVISNDVDRSAAVGVFARPVPRGYTLRSDRPNWYTIKSADLSNPGLPSVSFSITPAFSSKYLSDQQLFDTVRMLRLNNTERDSRIADRLTALYQDAIAESQNLLPDSIKQFREFFLAHCDLGVPKITLTPDGTLRTRWIQSNSNFAAIEFTGRQVVRFIAEIPRAGGLTARYFSSEPMDTVLQAAIALGSSFL